MRAPEGLAGALGLAARAAVACDAAADRADIDADVRPLARDGGLPDGFLAPAPE